MLNSANKRALEVYKQKIPTMAKQVVLKPHKKITKNVSRSSNADHK